MKTCIILHNMIVEDERNNDNLNNNYLTEAANPFVIVDRGQQPNLPDKAW